MITYDTIAGLAPSADTLAKARGVSYARKRWLLLEGNETLLWGIYAGGGNQQYQVAVDLEEAKFLCNCPSKDRPCKHGLALLFLLFRANENFQVKYDLPFWVKRWHALQSGEEIPVNKDEPADLDQKAKTEDKRRLAIVGGVAELSRWLNNLIETGLAATDSYDSSFWEDFATRMVDAKMSSIARRIRLMADLAATENFPDLLLREIADLHLFTQGMTRLDKLPPDLQREVLTTAGVNTKKDEVLRTGQPLKDHWLVIGIREGSEENLNFRRTWLAGEQSGSMALLLDFAWGNRGYDTQWTVGSALDAELVFYPGAYAQRALVKSFRPSNRPFKNLHAYASLTAFAESYAQAIGQNPWLTTFPSVLDGVVLTFIAGKFLLVDQDRYTLPLLLDEDKGWTAVALSGGHPLTIFGEWNGDQLVLLTLIDQGRIVELGVV